MRDKLIEMIRRQGPITFAEYMEIALYDPVEGFYARPPVGARGDFVTSPHVSAAFGDLLAVQLRGCWERLGSPDPFDVVEAGAGDGTLATRLLSALSGAVPLRYRALERSAGARDALARAGIEAHGEMSELGTGLTGCVVANELLDNLAFHRLRRRDGEVVEVFIGVEGDRLVEVEGLPTVAAFADGASFAEGKEHPVSPSSLAFVRAAVGALERGYVLIYDYGFVPPEAPNPVRSYQGQRVHDRVLENPGAADITAGVDFGAISAEAIRAGCHVWGPSTQRDVLLALGFDEWMDGLREARLQAEKDGRSRDALRLLAERTKAPLLVDPAQLGALKVVAFGVGDAPPPPGFDGWVQ